MPDSNDDLAPELHNSEQDNESSQAQTVAKQARNQSAPSPIESLKGPNQSDLMDDSTQDLIDHMRDMESSGRIDMDAYRGEPNLDDDEDKYAESNKVDSNSPM